MTFKKSLILCIFLSILISPGDLVSGELRGGISSAGEKESDEKAGSGSSSMLDNLARKLGFGGFSADSGESSLDRAEFREKMTPCMGNVIDTIIVTGNRNTRPETIIREMASRIGSRLDDEILYRDDSYLRGLGFFSVVDITVEQIGAERCRLIVNVEERPRLFMKYPLPLVDYDFDKGMSYGVRWRIKNFRGAGEDILMTYEERPTKERGGGIGWYSPWAAGRRMRLFAGVYNYLRLEPPDYIDYIKERNEGRVMVGFPLTDSRVRQIWLSPSIGLEGRLSRLSIDDDSADPDGDWISQTLISFGLNISYDSRDNIIAPLDGYYAAVGVNRFSTIDGYAQRFTFYRFISNLYQPVLNLGSLIAAVDIENRDGDLSSFYNMRLGGKNELRGYRGDEGGRLRVIGSIQWRRPVFGPSVFRFPFIGRFDLAVNGVAFMDNGTLVSSFRDLDDSRFLSSGGFGFEILSPFQDLIRIEWAFCQGETPTFFITTNKQF
ncbi:MAG: BamA/TamA family outer membrane protein [Candidatus Krumholzibacteriota bacterium]|nr:BamA/TamA family outer membrane protein [Candidatus Krumholzibacteriota bacterium]